MLDTLTEKLQRIANLSKSYEKEDERINQQILELERMFCSIGVPFSSQYKINEYQSLVWDKEKRGIYVWFDKDKSQYQKLTALSYELKCVILKFISPLLDDIIKQFESELNIGKALKKSPDEKIELDVSQEITEAILNKKKPGRPPKK